MFDRIYSIKSGIVVDVRGSMGILEYKANSLGNYIEIETLTSWGTKTRIKYCHIGSPQYNIGDVVNQGDFIGYIGRSGNAAAIGVTTHLHIQSKEQITSSWLETDPLNYFDTSYDNQTFEPTGSKSNCQ